MHALALAGAHAVLAMAADRYALVGEAALYVLVALLLSVSRSRAGCGDREAFPADAR
jgi:hypothetical protein